MSHPEQIPVFTSEQASDAILEAGSVANRLIQSPCTMAELSHTFPHIPPTSLERLLRKLVRGGIATRAGETFEVTTGLIMSYPQGRQMDYLSRLLIPTVVNLSMGTEEGLLLPLHLNLPPEGQETFFDDQVMGLFKKLSSLADESGNEGQEHILFAAGTPRVPQGSEGFDRAFEILRNAATDRTDPVRRPSSVLSYFQGRLDSPSRAHRAILQFEEELQFLKTTPKESNFAFLLGFGKVLPQGDS